MFPVPLVTSSTVLTPTQFWDIVLLYHNRPHLINRKLVAASQVLFYKINFHSKNIRHISEILTPSAILYELRKLKQLTKENIHEDFIVNLVECYDKHVSLSACNANDFRERYNGIFISVRILMPRKGSDNCIELVVLDKNKNCSIFYAIKENDTHLLAPPFPYDIELTSLSNLRINLQNFEDADTAHAEWIADKLFPKLLKWAESDLELNTLSSLSVISVDDYCFTYNDLKSKYGENLVKQWPEKTNTDPKKYVFEDLAIASYLICLWKKYNVGDVNFVDCGCGNGLLVYILNQEGYKGYGVDIRQRPIWNIYPKETRLEVGTVTPSSTFPSSTWIIGNHSDELTPWIPVIAIKSSPRTNIFVIPCCPYDFSGTKYVRTNTAVSQYSDYFSYIENIYNMCGFDTRTDKLRIPSTKRKCLIGFRKTFGIDEINQIDAKVNLFIESRLSCREFKARSNTETVRNCTQLNRDLLQKLVSTCVYNLLHEANYVLKENGGNWNKGGSLSLLDLSKKIAKEDLKQLKEQCGGLQTLIRNHRYLFDIRDGKVFLRKPPLLSEDTKKYKEKPCWFFKNHPDGCLHSSENNCSYKHEK
ncbi:hypothetical protein NQ315_000051 [Exocentrus adspersus]|uniref:tRNA (uracil-O(2)-)-methyltransferase n=1 Tax=Exocentrus adspersus TaxID=1586481 RepID=A0AAV8VTJ7_9CUCU|nr:hypothetical protein NQ315_000051 [Exocentrus adspersus]